MNITLPFPSGPLLHSLSKRLLENLGISTDRNISTAAAASTPSVYKFDINKDTFEKDRNDTWFFLTYADINPHSSTGILHLFAFSKSSMRTAFSRSQTCLNNHNGKSRYLLSIHIKRKKLYALYSAQDLLVENAKDIKTIPITYTHDAIDSSSPASPEQIKKLIRYYIRELKERTKTDIRREIYIRLYQSYFRQQLMQYWEGKCALTGIEIKEVLRASHIKPWSESNHEERLDCHNGILLIANYDALFDKGLITFTNNGHMLVSSRLSLQQQQQLGLHSDMRLRKPLEKEFHIFLDWHRKNIFN